MRLQNVGFGYSEGNNSHEHMQGDFFERGKGGNHLSGRREKNELRLCTIIGGLNPKFGV